MKSYKVTTAVALALISLAFSNARAAIVLDLPDLVLLPETSGQTFTIEVQNDGSALNLSGVQLDLMTATGDASGRTGPAIEDVSLISSGLLFASNNNGHGGAGDFGGLEQIFQRTTATSSGFVSLPGASFSDLFTITFDTTGYGSGTYGWTASGSLNDSSIFYGEGGTPIGGVSFTDGTLTISAVPEPHEYALIASLGLLGWAIVRKRKTSSVRA